MKEQLLGMAVRGELARHDEASKEMAALLHEKKEGSGRVMVIDENNYRGHSSRGFLVFQCSLCPYVGERYYHAGTHSCTLLTSP